MLVSANWLAALRAYLLTTAGADLFWEAVHLPLYTLWQTESVGANIFAVAHCTLGDVLIALASLTIALILVGHRDWPIRRFVKVAALTLVLGGGYTVFSEWLNVIVRRSWTYSSLMPIVSLFGFVIGISPLLQWVVVPILALCMARRTGTRRTISISNPINGVVEHDPTR
jgi:hypothetical protein